MACHTHLWVPSGTHDPIASWIYDYVLFVRKRRIKADSNMQTRYLQCQCSELGTFHSRGPSSSSSPLLASYCRSLHRRQEDKSRRSNWTAVQCDEHMWNSTVVSDDHRNSRGRCSCHTRLLGRHIHSLQYTITTWCQAGNMALDALNRLFNTTVELCLTNFLTKTTTTGETLNRELRTYAYNLWLYWTMCLLLKLLNINIYET